MEILKAELKKLGKAWKASRPTAAGQSRPPLHPKSFTPVIEAAHDAVSRVSMRHLGSLTGLDGQKEYGVFESNGKRSRPFRTTWIFSDGADLVDAWDQLANAVDANSCTITGHTPEQVDRVLYAVTHYVACAFDLFTDNRASAGKFFEYLTGCIVAHLCNGTLAPLPAVPTDDDPEGYAVPVDVVIDSPGRAGKLILASKLTSRERIVQPFVHRLMVNDAYSGDYKTLILCGSETNRLEKHPGLQETCVPGTIEAYRRTLGNVDGIYYLDLPKRYADAAFAKHIPVSGLGELLCGGLDSVYSPI